MKIKANNSIWNTSILLIGGVMGLIFCWYSIGDLWGQKYIQLVDLFISLVLASVSIASFYYLFKNETYELENNKLTVSSFNGLNRATYRLQDLKSYTAIKKDSKHLDWEDLDLYFPTKKIRITSSNIGVDYHLIKRVAVEFADENTEAIEEYASKSFLQLGFFFIIVATLFFFILNKQDKNGNKIIDESNSSIVTGVLANQSKVKSVQRSSKLELKLTDHPDHSFILNGSELKALLEKEFEDEISVGDEVDLRIWKTTFDKKISKTEALSFQDKHFGFENIDILGIMKDGKDYLPLASITKERQKFYTKTNHYGLMLFVFFQLSCGAFLIKKGILG